MITLIALVGSLVVFRTLGVLGVTRFASWPVSAAHALAVMLVMTGTAHFMPASVTVMPNYADMVAMIPPFVPFPGFMVLASGVLELLAALGLILTRTRWIAGWALVPLFLLLLPANIYAAIDDVPFAGEPASPLWQRIPEQVLYIGFAVWATRSAPRVLPVVRGREPSTV
ncbi:DoxX family protein [Nocardia sp. IBHARD005]|uniref:DoxX family protein n=1 Tax=Nocardia sp. IBHARD005 TaxID=3457765 RepID=UPI004059FB0D